MSDRQLQKFFLRFAAGVAASICVEAATLNSFWWLAVGGAVAWIALRALVIASGWYQLRRHDRMLDEGVYYGAHVQGQQDPIDRKALIFETYDLAGWALCVAVGVILAWFTLT